MKEQLQRMQDELAADRQRSQYQIRLLRMLADLKEAHVTDAAIAAALLDRLGGSQEALQWIKEAHQDLQRMLRSLALHVALETKEQQPGKI